MPNLGISHVLPESVCPHCGKQLTRACEIEGNGRPSPGDYTACIRCGSVLRFGDCMQLLQTTEAELLQNLMPKEREELRFIRLAILSINSGATANSLHRLH